MNSETSNASRKPARAGFMTVFSHLRLAGFSSSRKSDSGVNIMLIRQCIFPEQPFFQEQLVQHQIRDSLPKKRDLLLQFLQGLDLAATKSTVLLAPSVVSLLRYTERPARLGPPTALEVRTHLIFVKHADNLFRDVGFTAHSVLPPKDQNAPDPLNKPRPLLWIY